MLHEWRDHELLRQALGTFGLESLATDDEAPAEIVALAEQRVEARAAETTDDRGRFDDESR